ncbi:MAG: sensor histidine kinase [Ferruginibacter sp.]
MENNGSLYSFLLQLVCGAALVTAFYHLIVYFYQKESLFLYYSLYLFVTAVFISYRVINYYFYNGAAVRERWFYSTEEVLQAAHYYFYFVFGIMAYRHYHCLPGYLWKYWKYFLSWSLPVYALSFFLLSFFNHEDKYHGLPQQISILFRLLLFVSSLFIQFGFFRNARNGILKLILVAGITYFCCGLLAMISNLKHIQFFNVPDIAWIFIGIFLDILFFSAAMGARLKGIAEEQKDSLLKIQQQEIEKLGAVYAMQDKERRRISQELHDDIGSTLSSISLMSTVLKKRITDKPHAALQLAEKMEDTSRQMINTMSDIVWSNNPENDSIQHLVNRLQQFMTNAFENSSTNSSLFVNKPADENSINMEIRRELYLICKEIINNACKYSRANTFALNLSFNKDNITGEAMDDGIGFEEPTTRPGNGLNNIRQRIKKHGGTVTLHSKTNDGTKWNFNIPLHLHQ